LASEAYERDFCWLEQITVDVHSIEGAREDDISEAACVHMDFSNRPSLDICFYHHGVGVWIH
jgi:hypothetical protein